MLMLRGPQTPGELKQRTERMYASPTCRVQETLERLIDRELARRLERRPGHKEERYVQLLGEGASRTSPGPAADAPQVAEQRPARRTAIRRRPPRRGPGAPSREDLHERVERSSSARLPSCARPRQRHPV